MPGLSDEGAVYDRKGTTGQALGARGSHRCDASTLGRRSEKMRVRRQTVEHPFGTIKLWMGWTHFLTKTLDRVSTEMSLHVLAYNIKRVIKILGAGALIKAIRSLKVSSGSQTGTIAAA
jgi:hypothetical protein